MLRTLICKLTVSNKVVFTFYLRILGTYYYVEPCETKLSARLTATVAVRQPPFSVPRVTVLVFASLAVAGTVVDMLYDDDSGPGAPPRPREDPATKGEQMKLVEGRPASYSALEQQEGPSARATGQP